MTDSLDESDASSQMEIEVKNNIRYQLHIAGTLAATLVTDHILKYAIKEQKRTSILQVLSGY